MPVYNVERYISDTLDSLITQESDNIVLDIIIIDDGSTDLTKRIIRSYQKKYNNIKLVEVNQIGPGAARNIAIQQAESDYIAFIDGDDLLYPNAYQKLLESISKNDADIVVGNVSRFNTTSSFFLSGLHKKIFSSAMEGTHISRYYPLLFDTTSWNKLFKTSFLKEENILFPEGILYEDIPFNMEAHIKSRKTNIIMDYIYKWQLRDDVNKSITQSRVDIKNMIDRIKAMSIFNVMLEENNITDIEFLEQKELKELSLDLKLFLDQLDKVDDDYFYIFSNAVSNYVSSMKTNVFKNKLPAHLRIKYQLLIDHRKEDLLDLLQHTQQFHLVKTFQNGYDVYKDIKDTRFEKYLSTDDVYMNSDITPIVKVQRVHWEGNNLIVKGYSFLKYLNTDKKTRINAILVDKFDLKRVSLSTKLRKDRNITQMHGGGKQEYLFKRYVNYDYSSFEIEIDICNSDVKSMLNDDCLLKLVIENAGHKEECYIKNPVKGYKARPKDRIVDNIAYSVDYDKFWRLNLTSSEIGGRIENIILTDSTMEINGYTTSLKYREVCLKNYTLNQSKKFQLKYENSENNYFTITLDLSIFAEMPKLENYYLYLLDGEREIKLELSNNIQPLCKVFEGIDIYFEKTRNSLLKISRNDKIAPKLDNLIILEKETNKFEITIEVNQTSIDRIQQAELVLVRDSDGFTINYPHTKIKNNSENYIITYIFYIDESNLSMFGTSKLSFQQKIYTHLYNEKQEIIYINSKGKQKFKIRNNHFSLIKVSPRKLQLITWLTKSYFDKGPRRLKLLKEYLYPLMRMLPQKKNYVMFESYWGRSYSCNPKALYEQMIKEYPNMIGIWSFNNPYIEVSGKAKIVKRNSWQYYYYLARSKYFINNVNWPTEYNKRKNSIEVQTLHGTFLKTMGLDVKNEVDTVQKLEGFRKRHKRWDYLVSPSRFMTDISKRVFEFEGEMLEYGFPRNDLLINQPDENLSKNIRLKLQLPKDKKVILYAPTYRNKNGFNLELDLEKMRDMLSDDYVLLVRLHYFVAKNIDLTGMEDFVINVCNYPDVQELLMITDVLITDYSSIMFDYANLDRPMIFFTYDLDYYRDILRGMYLDFEKEAPGKLCSTNTELIGCLNNLSLYEQSYRESRREFRRKYNEFETGRSSKLILDNIFKK